MPKIRFYRYALSGHCHRVELFMSMLGLPFEAIDVDLAQGRHKQPEFLALNAFGQVPVIDDGGEIVADSNAILVYLALRYAEPSWLPRDAAGAAAVQRWLSVAAGPLAFGPARARAVALFGQVADTQPAVQLAHTLFGLVDKTLSSGQRFIAGDAPTIADLALYGYTVRAPEGSVSLADYPALRAWLQRVEALPRFVPMPASAIGLAA